MALTFDVRSCRGCGCTDDDACWPPCFWVGEAWCSACEHRLGRHLSLWAAAFAFLAAASALAAGIAAAEAVFDATIALAIVSAVAVAIALVLGTVGTRMLEVER